MLGPLHYIMIRFPPHLTVNVQSLHFITFLLHLIHCVALRLDTVLGTHWHPRSTCCIEHVNRKVWKWEKSNITLSLTVLKQLL